MSIRGLASSVAASEAIASRSTLLILAIACGLAVGNVYFNQPLLADIGREFKIPVQQIGSIPALTQIGYAVGLIFLAPLGDRTERRSLIVALFLLIAGAMVSAALSPNLIWLCVSSLVIGLATMVGQLVFPLVAQLPEQAQRTHATGILLSGLILGTLLLRAVSGFLGDLFGWRSVYWLLAVLAVIVALVIQRQLPLCPASSRLSYQQLLRSLVDLARQQPTLQAASINNALLFAAFNAFWATLIFFLEAPPYHYGSQAAGLFALLSVVGAVANPLIGKFNAQYGSRTVVEWAIVTLLLAFAVLWLMGQQLGGLAVGVIILEIGISAAYFSNRIRLFNLVPDAESRLNTVFMVANYCGGMVGSYLGAVCWAAWQWNGVCALELSLVAIAAVLHFSQGRSAQFSGR